MLLDVADGIARIRLNRPEAANAVDAELLRALHEAVLRCHADPTVRVVILSGEGRNFCAGGDVKTFASKGEDLPDYLREATAWLQLATAAIIQLKAPVIAQVQGFAAGGAGFGFVCAADLVVAAEGAKFFSGAVRVGMAPDAGTTVTLSADRRPAAGDGHPADQSDAHRGRGARLWASSRGWCLTASSARRSTHSPQTLRLSRRWDCRRPSGWSGRDSAPGSPSVFPRRRGSSRAVRHRRQPRGTRRGHRAAPRRLRGPLTMTGSEDLLVLVEDHGAVRVLTLNRPQVKNAIDLPLRYALADAIEGADAAPSVRAVVLTGAGGAFCSGGDISTMERAPRNETTARAQAAQRVVRAIWHTPKPVVAAVEGPAYGAGAALALACDRVVAAADATFATTFTGVGLAGDMGIFASLPARVGAARARQMLMLGTRTGGAEGAAIGLVDRVVDPGAALESALEDAQLLAAGPPLALGVIKQMLAAGPRHPLEVLDLEVRNQTALWDTDDFAEGVAGVRREAPAGVRLLARPLRLIEFRLKDEEPS